MILSIVRTCPVIGEEGICVLKHLKSADDFNAFNLDKVLRLESQHTEMWKLLNSIKSTIEENKKTHEDVQVKISEISELQLSLSDVQIFLLREREENLRLAADNDFLKIKNIENERAIEILLQLSGLNRTQLSEILSTENENVPSKFKLTESSMNKPTGVEPSKEFLILQVKSLKTQLENLKILFRSEVDVLLKDREVLAEERIVITRKLKQEVSQISKELYTTQVTLCDSIEKLFCELMEQRHEISKNIDDRLDFENRMKTVNRYLGDEFLSEPVLNLNGIGKSRIRSCNIKRMQQQIEEKEELVTLYQNQVKKFENDVRLWKGKAEAAEKLLKEKTQKLTAEINVLRNRYEDLDRRRFLEGEGFRADIKILRDKLKDLEKKLNKMKAEHAFKSPSTEEENLQLSTKHTLLKAKQLEKELAVLRLKVAALTNKII